MAVQIFEFGVHLGFHTKRLRFYFRFYFYFCLKQMVASLKLNLNGYEYVFHRKYIRFIPKCENSVFEQI